MDQDLVPQPRPGVHARRRRMGVAALMVLVACAGALLWTSRVAWENRDRDHATAQAAARATRSWDLVERLSAIRDLGRFGSEAQDIALPALISALEDDADADARAAAAEALTAFTSDAAGSRTAAAALLGSLKDRRPAV